jgi:hypothetical protein
MKLSVTIAATLALCVMPSSLVAKDEEKIPFAHDVTGPEKADIVSQAPVVSNTQKWEYLYVGTKTYQDKEKNYRSALYINRILWKYDEGLNYLGSLGWELVAVTGEGGYVYFFKRPIAAN